MATKKMGTIRVDQNVIEIAPDSKSAMLTIVRNLEDMQVSHKFRLDGRKEGEEAVVLIEKRPNPEMFGKLYDAFSTPLPTPHEMTFGQFSSGLGQATGGRHIAKFYVDNAEMAEMMTRLGLEQNSKGRPR